jgi:Protein of unknown function (DUF2845)
VVCLAPRAQETSVRPRRLSDASARPLNFTVSCHIRRRAVRVAAIIFALLVVLPSVCRADGFFRCGNSLVSADLSVAELVKKCGQPSSKEVSTHDVYKRGVRVGLSTTTEIWRYDRGYSAAPMIVTILDGRIQSIKEGR